MKTQYSKQLPTNILFTHYGDEWIRGSERCLLDLLTYLDREQYTPIVWCNSRAMTEEVYRLNVTVIQSEFSLLLGWKQPYFDLSAFFKLIKQGINLVDKYNVALIHANSGAPNQWLNFVARARGIPLVSHLHSRYPLRDRITLGLHQVTKVIGVSAAVSEQITQDGVPSDYACVIPNGIDTKRLNKQERVDLRQWLNLKKEDFLLATTASLIHRKGIDLLIDATARLIKQGVPVHLIVIGDGPERQNLLYQIHHLDIEDNVHLLGEKSNVVGLLRGGVDLFVSAAREEVFGLVLAEAGLSQLAVVAPSVGGIPSVIIDNKTGLLVPPEDTQALTAAISYLYKVPDQRKKMGHAGYQHVMDNFTIEQNTKSFESIYKQMLCSPKMHMRWYSHWKLRGIFKVVCKSVFNLSTNKYKKETTS